MRLELRVLGFQIFSLSLGPDDAASDEPALPFGFCQTEVADDQG